MTILQRYKPFLLFLILSIVCYELIAKTSFTPYVLCCAKSDLSVNRILKKPQSGSPLEYDASDNFAIAAGIIADPKLTPTFSSVMTGKIVANLFNYTQEVKVYKKAQGDKIFEESISLSKFASVAERKYFENGKIFISKAKTRGKKILCWQNKTDISAQEFNKKYGIIPREITKYSVNENSYKSGELINNTNNNYTYKMELDATLAQQNSSRELTTFSGSKTPPKFFSCTLTFTIDNEWRIKSIISQDYYQLSIFNGIKCHSTLTENFN